MSPAVTGRKPEPPSVVAFSLVAAAAGVLAAIGPARRAARLDPLRALGHE